MSRSLLAFASLGLLVVFSGCASGPATPPTRSWARDVDALDRLRSVVEGSWEGTSDQGQKALVEYHAISGGCTIAETFGPRARPTMTLFHADRGELVATHYCAQGNQPRLRAVAISSRSFAFALESVTDLDPGEAHLVKLELLADGDALERVEVYQDASGRLERTHFRFVRAST